ncbi:OmpA family protein [Roseomonas sp. OT10]|uniref:OmpA family protein n=1 Tax=Roseomonas cutis TaxID=2897332 RepID=UPI001E5013CC|nr:OmpA family protein [Roseomonas sp. OT10]UFN51059.1 OmpA family protein [Roseomonas sp. OT10]
MRRRFLVSLAALPLLAACSLQPELAAVQSRVVFFSNDATTLDDSGKAVVAEAAEIAKRYAGAPVNVLGYAGPPDRVGQNVVALSRQRAEAVAAELRAQGVPPVRIQVLPLGAVSYEASPVESRRVEIRIAR